MQLQNGEAAAAVAVVSGRLEVMGWSTDIPEVVKYFEERAASDAALDVHMAHVTRVGVLALRAVGLSVNVDYLEREFQRVLAQMEDDFDSRVRQVTIALDQIFSEGGSLSKALNLYLGEGGHLSDLFDPQRRDSAVGRIHSLLDEHFDGKGSKMHRLLDITDPESPLYRMSTEFRQEVEKLRKVIEEYRTAIEAQLAGKKAREETMEKTAIKGFGYEDRVFAAVAEIARHFGDTAEATGDALGIGGAKAGDTVVTVNARETAGATVRVVFEAKDRSVGLTGIIRELESAKGNRQAALAVAVYSAAEHMPSNTTPFHEVRPTCLVCLFPKEDEDPSALQLAYRTARYWAIKGLAAATSREMNPAQIREALGEARQLVGSIAGIKTKLTRIRSAVSEGAETLQEDLDTLRDGLSAIFERVDRNLVGGGAEELSLS